MDEAGRRYLDLFLWIVVGVMVGTAVFVLFLSPGAEPAEPAAPVPAEPPEVPAPPEPTEPTLSEVEVTHITYDDCEECQSSTYLLDEILQLEGQFGFDITVNEVTHDSTEGAALIEQYSITKLPSLVISKEAGDNEDFSNVWVLGIGTVEGDGNFVFRELYPPYYDMDSASVKGMVDAYVIAPDENCLACEDLNGYLDFLAGEQVLVYFTGRTQYNQSEPEAQELIGKYNITKLPVFILGKDISTYSIFDDQISGLVSQESDGYYVLRELLPPYTDVETGEVKGAVSIVYLTDPSCEDCFDPVGLTSGMVSFGIYIAEERTVELNSTEGQALLVKYNISKVPTMLVSPDASMYPGFTDAWAELNGPQAEDGWYVFNSHELITPEAIYRDLSAPESEEEPPAEESSPSDEDDGTEGS